MRDNAQWFCRQTNAVTCKLSHRESWIPNRDAINAIATVPKKIGYVRGLIGKRPKGCLIVKRGSNGVDHRGRSERAVSKCQRVYKVSKWGGIGIPRWWNHSGELREAGHESGNPSVSRSLCRFESYLWYKYAYVAERLRNWLQTSKDVGSTPTVRSKNCANYDNVWLRCRSLRLQEIMQ